MKARSRISNLSDKRNPDLRLNVLKGIITPEQMAKMESSVSIEHVLLYQIRFILSNTFYCIRNVFYIVSKMFYIVSRMFYIVSKVSKSTYHSNKNSHMII